MDERSKDLRRTAWVMASLTAVGLAGLVALVCWAEEEDDFKPVTVLRPQPTITQFEKRPVVEVANELNPSELVIGVTVGDESRAYPINMLTGPAREILNDTLGDTAIAATW